MLLSFISNALPKDKNNNAMQIVPSVLSLAITYDTTISTSTTVTFNVQSTLIEVTAINTGVFMKWGGTASSASFDEFISAGTTRHYAIPINASTSNKYTTAQFIEQSAGATLVVIEK